MHRKFLAHWGVFGEDVIPCDVGGKFLPLHVKSWRCACRPKADGAIRVHNREVADGL